MAKLAFLVVILANSAYEVSAACRDGLQCQPESATSAIALVQKSRGLLNGSPTPEEDQDEVKQSWDQLTGGDPFAMGSGDPLAELDRESLGSSLQQEDVSREEILNVVNKLVAENQKLSSRVSELEKMNARVQQLEQVNAQALQAMPHDQKQESFAQASSTAAAKVEDPDAGKAWWEIEWGVHSGEKKSTQASSLQVGGQQGGGQSEVDKLRLDTHNLLNRVSQLEQLVLAIPVEKLQKDGQQFLQREGELEQLVLKLTQDMGHGSRPSSMYGAQDNMMMPSSPYTAGMTGGMMQQNQMDQNQMLQGRVSQLEALLEHRR